MTELAKAARAIKSARARLDAAMAAGKDAAIAAYESGMPETQIARELGVDRARTLRRWLGKST